MRAAPSALLPLLAVIVACSQPTAPDAIGVWGGRDASLSLSRIGGTLSYQCGAGTIDGTWILTPGGRFSGTGQHFFGGGPVPPGGLPAHPARYSGLIEGNTLLLTVTLTDLARTLGPFSLRRGGPVVQEVCK